jgi:hypothetical protein
MQARVIAHLGLSMITRSGTRANHSCMWNAKAQPVVAKRLDALTAARDLLDARSGLIFKQVTKALGADWRQIDALKNASSEFEKSLIINRFQAAGTGE